MELMRPHSGQRSLFEEAQECTCLPMRRPAAPRGQRSLFGPDDAPPFEFCFADGPPGNIVPALAELLIGLSGDTEGE
jgi:hypothetical protein